MARVPSHPHLSSHLIMACMACKSVTLRLIAPVYCSFKISPWSAQLSHVLILLSIVIGAATTPVVRSTPDILTWPASIPLPVKLLKTRSSTKLCYCSAAQISSRRNCSSSLLYRVQPTCSIWTHTAVHMSDHCFVSTDSTNSKPNIIISLSWSRERQVFVSEFP